MWHQALVLEMGTLFRPSPVCTVKLIETRTKIDALFGFKRQEVFVSPYGFWAVGYFFLADMVCNVIPVIIDLKRPEAFITCILDTGRVFCAAFPALQPDNVTHLTSPEHNTTLPYIIFTILCNY